MKPIYKKTIIAFFIQGIVFSIGMAGFRYKDGEVFSWERSIYQFLFFGTWMAVFTFFQIRYKERKKNK